MTQAIYLGLRAGGEIDHALNWERTKYLFATWFGYSYEYTEAMPYARVLTILALRRGEAMASQED